MIFGGDPCSVNNIANDKVPILPRYINAIITACAKTFNDVVIPVDKPTVPIAENTSNNTSARSCAAFVALISIVAVSARIILNDAMAVAFFSAPLSRRLLRTSSVEVFLRLDKSEIIITAKVVVLIPPAVEPGLPPMNIKIIVSNLLAGDNAAVSIVLKPAVLGVTAQKSEVIILSPKLMPENVEPPSKIKKLAEPPTIRKAVVIRTIFV